MRITIDPRMVATSAASLVLAGSASSCGGGDSEPASEPEATGWATGAPLTTPRAEVAATAFDDLVVVAGGFLEDGANSTAVEGYSPADDSWTQLPDLPRGLNHAMAAAHGDRLYVLGGYDDAGDPSDAAFVLDEGRWERIPSMPEPRAAGGAAVVGERIYVVAGVGPGGLAERMLVFDPQGERWSTAGGPTPREHLGVAGAGGRIYAVAGRTGGFETNLDVVERYDAATGEWRDLPPVPEPRGGTAATVVGGALLSAGGERPDGAIPAVYALDLETPRWRELPRLPIARHGLGLVGLGGNVYAVAGGPEPGLSVSAANETLAVDE